MYKWIVAVLGVLLLQGCSSSEISRITDGVIDGTIDEVFRTSTPKSAQKAANKNSSYSVTNEKINLYSAKKTSRDYGQIAIARTEKNPKGQTRLLLNNCSHPRIGSLRCGGFIYEISEEGWLVDDRITFNDLNDPEIVLPAGRYYIKAHNWDSGQNRYVTGEFTLKPFVTNRIDLELE